MGCLQAEGGHIAAVGRRGHGANEESGLEVRLHLRPDVLPALCCTAAAEQRSHDAYA